MLLRWKDGALFLSAVVVCPPCCLAKDPAVHWGSGWIGHEDLEVLLLCGSVQGFARWHPPPPLSPLQLPHPNYSLESVRGVRCHRPSTLSHMTLKSENSVAYWFACVRYSKLWLAFASKPAPLHTSLNGVARKFSANCARINQRVPLTERHCCICQRKFVFGKIKFCLNLSFFVQKKFFFLKKTKIKTTMLYM